MDDVLSYFGEVLITKVRDRTIRNFDMRIAGMLRDEESQELHKVVQQLDEGVVSLINRIIPQIVDLSIHNLLCMIEEHPNIQVQIEMKNISEESDGLTGELYTEDGWIQRFSKQRYEDK